MKLRKNPRLEARRKKISNETKLFIDNSFQIVDRIHEILESKGLEQKDLAIILHKSESEISKWMTGTHNFTLKTISKIENILEEKLLKVSIKKKVQAPFILILNNSVNITPKGDMSRIKESYHKNFDYSSFN